MSSYELDIKNFTYENFSNEDIKMYEESASNLIIDKKSKKEELRREITKQNLQILDEKINSELDCDEEIEVEFDASPTSLQYFVSLFNSADYIVIPSCIAIKDLGRKYKIFTTSKKILMYEILNLCKVNREYVINKEDIKVLKGNVNKNSVKLTIKVEKDKYDSFRETGAWFMYQYMNKSVHLELFSKDREIILRYFDKWIKN